MYRSLEKVCQSDFVLYVIAFDQVCNDVLCSKQYKNLKVIPLEEFEGEELLKVKASRSTREYLWTCSSMSVKYVLDKYDEESCTYIDSDLFFFMDPQALFDEIIQANCDVGIMLHGYIDTKENKRYIDYSGKYCVEFNYFRNNPNGRKVLSWWCNKCLECCTETSDGVHFGDQKYVEEFEKLFDNVHVFRHRGAGVAPWNLSRYRLTSYDNERIRLSLKEDGRKIDADLIFYHFQQISYLTASSADIHVYMYPCKPDRKLVDILYSGYLKEISSVRRELSVQYGLDWSSSIYGDREHLGSFLISVLKYERDPVIALRRLCRWLLRKKRDYYEWVIE